MAQPTFTQVRQALAAYITTVTGLRASADRFGTVSPPMAVIVPVTGTSITYSDTFDGGCELSLRAVVLISEAGTDQGQAAMDPYLSTSGPQSIWGAVQADPTLGHVVQWAIVREVAGYGVMNWNGIDYLAASVIVDLVI